MRGNLTLNLWDISDTSERGPKMVLPGQVLNIGGIECSFVGISLDHSAYFWIGPGNARYMNNDEMRRFNLAVVSVNEGIRKLIESRNGKPA
jgi:hypothetical protein